MNLSKLETSQVQSSIQKYFREELEIELSEMQVGFLLNFFSKEIAPFAYNQGVKDAEAYFRAKVEELPAICFQDGLTYWVKKKK